MRVSYLILCQTVDLHAATFIARDKLARTRHESIVAAFYVKHIFKRYDIFPEVHGCMLQKVALKKLRLFF